MQIQFGHSPKESAGMSTSELRSAFLTGNLMQDDTIQLVYTHYDRVIMGGVKPVTKSLPLETHPELKSDYFLERRELGIINIGGKGRVHTDGGAHEPGKGAHELDKLDCLYLGKGVKKIEFQSLDAGSPALFYLLSAPAHITHPIQFLGKDKALPAEMGAPEMSNVRTIYKYIHAQGIQSAQLVMGLTILKKGSVWNTMPAHTHTRRMEAYFYFDVHEGQRIFHFMGQPNETRHLLVDNHQAVVSPPWSIHSGCGTGNYAFIWGMAGENYAYTDMDPVSLSELR
jgi:4-deoxy-L-threo-5-hexosulose-uronate ketol-isomerase